MHKIKETNNFKFYTYKHFLLYNISTKLLYENDKINLNKKYTFFNNIENYFNNNI